MTTTLLENLRHPIFEIAENTPVFLINGKAYSLGEGNLDRGEDRYIENKRGRVLIEIGDLKEFDELVINRVFTEYKNKLNGFFEETKRELIVTNEEDLDTAQIIAQKVLPYLRGRNYTDKLESLLEIEKKEKRRKETSKPKFDSHILDRIVSDTEKAVYDMITSLSNKRVKAKTKERNVKQKALDDMFEYRPQINTDKSAITVIAEGGNLALIEGEVYDIVSEGLNNKRVRIDGHHYDLRKRKDTIQNAKKGTRVRIKKDSKYSRQNDGVGTIEEEFKVSSAKVVFDNGYRNYYPLDELDSEDTLTISNLEKQVNSEIEDRIKIQALKDFFTKQRIREMAKEGISELTRFKGKEKYAEGDFGFLMKDGRYYVYLEVPAFAIKSHFDGNYYLFEKSRVGIHVAKQGGDGNTLGYEDEFIAIDNNNHPFLHQSKSNFARICMGETRQPTRGKDDGDVIAKRLRACKEVLMYGYTGASYREDYQLTVEYFGENKVSEKKVKERKVELFIGGPR